MVTTPPRVEVTSVRLQSRSDVSNEPQASACGVSSRKTPSREAAAEGNCDRHHRASAAASRLSDIYGPFPVGRRPRLIAAVASRLRSMLSLHNSDQFRRFETRNPDAVNLVRQP